MSTQAANHPKDLPAIRWGFVLRGVTTWAPLLSLLLLQTITAWQLKGGGHDLGGFIASGRLVLTGLDPYGPHPLIYTFDSPFGIIQQVNLNPPAWLPLFATLAILEPAALLPWWALVQALGYGLALLILARLYHPSPLRLAWAVALAGFWGTLGDGQVYGLVALLVALGWSSLTLGHSWRAGLALGLLVALKPPFALWALWLLLRGQRSIVPPALLAGTLACALPAILYGPIVYWQWLKVSASVNWLALPGNGSLPGLGAVLGWAPAGYLAAVFLAIYLGLTGRDQLAGDGLLLCLLASPLTWAGYTLTLLPLFWRQERWPWLLVLAAALLCLPSGWVWKAGLVWPPVGTLYVLALLLILAHARSIISTSAKPM